MNQTRFIRPLGLPALLLAALCLLSACGPSDSSSLPDETTVQRTGMTTTATQAETTRTEEGAAVTTTTSVHIVVPTAVKTNRPTHAPTKKPTDKPTAKPTAATVRVRITEGMAAEQIGDLLEKNGVCTKAGFLDAVNNYDFSYYPLVSQIPAAQNRRYKLEGYLFPDTYEFFRGAKPQDAVGVLLRGAESRIGSQYTYSGMSTYQIVTLASIIEKEAQSAVDMQKVSAVFHNRLKQNMKLQADPTIDYVEKYIGTNKDPYRAAYNTYKCAALPVGPICNPGARALYAAAHPADVSYLYFCADTVTGQIYYADTLEEHNENLIKAHLATAPATTSAETAVQE